MLDAVTAAAWFRPRNMLVVGASKKKPAQGNMFIRRERQFGYQGPIYVVHPEGGTVEGEPAVTAIDQLPEPVDYAFVAVPAAQTADVIAACAGRVKIVQIMTSGFRELGAEGAEMEARLVATARAAGVRFIGPNCFGSYAPAGGLTMMPAPPATPGDAGFVSQSGGLACEVISMGSASGVRFSQVVAMGNCADLDTIDVLEYMVEGDETNCIGMYVEESQRPREFLRLLAAAEGKKPLVIMKGGMTREGGRAASSHTGSMADDGQVFSGIADQFGIILAQSPQAMAQVMSTCQLAGLRPWQGSPRCVLIGPGGGLGVMTVDTFSRLGLTVPPSSEALRSALVAAGLPPEGSGMANPIDVSVMTLSSRAPELAGRLFAAVAESGEADWIVAHISLTNLFGLTPRPAEHLDHFVRGVIAAREQYPNRRWCLVLRSSGEAFLDQVRDETRDLAIAARLPVFERLEDAGQAIAALARFERHRHRLGLDP